MTVKLRVLKELAVVVLASLSLATGAQTPILLNIGDSTYPTACTVANYQSVGVLGLTGTEAISQFAPAFSVGLASPMTFTNGGQVIFMDSTANGGTYAKNTGPGNTAAGGLLDLYLYTTTATARTMTVNNLNLIPSTIYILTLIGTVPVSGTNEDGLFTPLNTNPHITFASTTSGNGVFSVQFTTSAAYTNTDTLNFTWARYTSSGDGVFDGLAIVPAAAAVIAPADTSGVTAIVDPAVALTNYTGLGEWNTNGNFENWTTANISGATVSGGLLSGTAGGGNPQVMLTRLRGRCRDRAGKLQVRPTHSSLTRSQSASAENNPSRSWRRWATKLRRPMTSPQII